MEGGDTNKRDIPSWFVEVDSGNDNMGSRRANLGHDGKNGAGSPIWLMESLVVDDDSRGWWGRYRRH
jgi:hypothetical protein